MSSKHVKYGWFNNGKKSELEKLMEKNVYGEGLNKEEFNKALGLIVNPVVNEEEECWVCSMYGKENPSIYDTGVCSKHAKYALFRRK